MSLNSNTYPAERPAILEARQAVQSRSPRRPLAAVAAMLVCVVASAFASGCGASTTVNADGSATSAPTDSPTTVQNGGGQSSPGSPGSSPTGSLPEAPPSNPDGVVSSPPAGDPMLPPDPGFPNNPGFEDASDVPVDPNAKFPHHVTLNTLEVVDGEIQMTWWGGACDRVVSINTISSATEITVDLQVGTDPAADACNEMAVLSRATITPTETIGDRPIVDANAAPLRGE